MGQGELSRRWQGTFSLIATASGGDPGTKELDWYCRHLATFKKDRQVPI